MTSQNTLNESLLIAAISVLLMWPVSALADEVPPQEINDTDELTTTEANSSANGEAATDEQTAVSNDPTSDQPGDDASTAKDGEPIDEVVVTAEGNLTFLRRQIIRAENDFYNLFNDLTSEDDFKIVCKKEKRHGFTNMIVRKCKSKYEDTIAFELTQRDRRLGSFERTSLPTTKQGEYEQRVAKRREEQLAEMARILQENPEFQQKLITLNEAKAKYDEVKAKK